jgi:hypothetical protein
MKRILLPTLTAAFLTGCACEKRSTSLIIPSPGPSSELQRPTILQQPETITAEAGTFVTFSVRVANAKHARYQWRFNERAIPKANKRELFLNRVSAKNVGAYSVIVSWAHAKLISTNAFLSVYKFRGTNSTSGTLTTSAQQFINYGGTGYVCATHPTASYDRSYKPSDSAGNFYFFYGPNVPISAQSGPFINWGHNDTLVIDTFATDTNTRPTALQFLNAFNPPVLNPDLGCNSNSSTGGLGFTFGSLATSTDPYQARYRAVIYYQSPAPASGNIILQWMYYDASDHL